MRPYRCYNPNCMEGIRPIDFWAEHGTCPKCGASLLDPGSKKFIACVEIVHFEPPGRFPGSGLGHWACNDKESVGVPFRGNDATGQDRATGFAGSVNCLECKKTRAWQEASGKEYVPYCEPNADYVVA